MLDSFSEIFANLRQGRMLVLVDEEDRENEGDLLLPAEFAEADKINFMMRKAGGLLCLALTSEQVDRLGLPLMVPENKNQSKTRTAFTVSIEAAQGVTSGVSAKDRAHTIRVASSSQAQPKDVISPGHIFPLRAASRGLQDRCGHTEAGIELCRLAGLTPAAVICEVLTDSGEMARGEELQRFARENDLPIVYVAELKKYLKCQLTAPSVDSVAALK